MAIPELYVAGTFLVMILLGWIPMLAFERVRALFVWPTRWTMANYAISGVGVVALQVLSYAGVVFVVAGTGPVTGSAAASIVVGIALANLVIPGILAVAAIRLLPRRGSWHPEAGGLSGRIALGVGILWYAMLTTGVVLLFGFVLLFANLPT